MELMRANVGLADKEIQEEIDTFMFEVIATEDCLIKLP
jgi:hypothetical protein